MNNQNDLNGVSLHQAAEMISNALIVEKSNLERIKVELQAEKKKYEEDYVTANDGDSSENAPLEAAINNLKFVTGKIASNAKVIQTMEGLEDAHYLRETFDFSELVDALSKLKEDSLIKLRELLKFSSIEESIKVLKTIKRDDLESAIKDYSDWFMATKGLNESDSLCLSKLLSYFEVAKKPKYNTCGIIVLYTTVRLKLGDRIMTYRIYPKGLSFIDIGVMAADSKVAQALMGKTKGDSITIQHTSKKTVLRYEIVDIY